jgi:hypothetical protein
MIGQLWPLYVQVERALPRTCFNRNADTCLDLASAVLGLTLFPAGYLLHGATKRRA